MLIVTTTEDCDKITITDMNSRDVLFEWTYGSDFEDVFANLEKLFNGEGVAYMVEEGEYEPLICGVCMGSGEGMYPDTICYSCRGKGEEIESRLI